ncbi:XTP/dITP diphosphatase [Bacillaceae bacterium S4-13-58]
MNKLVLGTKNQGKIKELKSLFTSFGIDAISISEIEGLPDIEETGKSFEENAALKAEGIMRHTGLPALADDSGLEVDALNGEPGIFSARYAGSEKDDQKNIDKLLQELKDVPAEKRQARFVCVIAVSFPNEETLLRSGTCEGMIAFEQKGDHGFGYDPVFYLPDLNKTMAELTPKEKNKISHRSRALQKVAQWFESRGEGR